MGGCRCTFRNCPNNTKNSPSLHFFRFPIKDGERCKKWALYANRVEFLKIPISQLRNKSVCGIHFADKFFMNYKKESLIRFAVPTLNRLADGNGMYEVEIDESKISELVYPIEATNLIDLPMEQEIRPTLLNEEEEQGQNIIAITRNFSEVSNRSQPTILNNIKRDESTSIATKIENKNFVVETNTNSLKRSYGSRPIRIIEQKKIKIEQNNVSVTPPKQRKCTKTITVGIAETSEDDSLPDVADDTTGSEQSNEKNTNKKCELNVYKKMYLDSVAEHAKQIDELKKMFAESLQRNEAKAKPPTNPTSSNDVSSVRVEKGPAMTKIQLFNGIRKYLNPTMVALLRMEMFGSSDRDYRPDEKQLSKELFIQSADVYEYMRDEWRFRLPAKSQVEAWLKENDEDDLDEPY